jgi:hypothetical protein
LLAKAVVAGPGSGTATISPDTAVVGTPGTWTIEYVTVDSLLNGTIRFKIPPGWTLPQDVDSLAAGYVSVTSDAPSANPSFTINGLNIRVAVDTVLASNKVTLVYENASPPNTAQSRVEFRVESDPTGPNPEPILTGSPTVDINAGPVADIEIAPADTAITAGDTLSFTIEAQDEFGNRTPLPADRSFDLNSAPQALATDIALAPQDNPAQFFLPSDPNTPIDTLTMYVGTESIQLLYRNTDANNGDTHRVFITDNDGLSPNLFATAEVTVDVDSVSESVSSVVAGSPVVANGDSASTVTVTLRDDYENPISGVNVTYDVTGDAVVEPGPLTDEDGITTAAVRDTTAEMVIVDVKAQGIALAKTVQIVFLPGDPSGTITATAERNTITANGISTTEVNSDPITDAHDNVVAEGTLIRLSTNDEENIDSPDDDPSTPSTIERKTDFLGRISFRVRSSTQRGSATVTMTSVTGTATGTKTIFFEPAPDFTAVGGVVPDVVERDIPVAFEIVIQNTTTTACTLSVTTEFGFRDDFDSFSTFLATETVLDGNVTDTLVFDEVVIGPFMDAKSYDPLLVLEGKDEFGSDFEQILQLSSVVLSGVDLVYVPQSLSPSALSIGRDHGFSVELRNNGVTPVTLDSSTTLEFMDGVTTYSAGITQPTALAAGGGAVTAEFNAEIVDSGFVPGPYDVTLYLEGNELGKMFTDTLIAGQITLESRALVTYVNESVKPTLVTKDVNARFSVDVFNSGVANVYLIPDSTRIRFGDFDAALEPASENVIVGNDTTTLTFESNTINADSGAYLPALSLVGSENGLSYRETLPVSDAVQVQLGAEVQIVSISANPIVVTADTIPLPILVSMEVSNAGDAVVDVGAASISLILAGSNHTDEFIIGNPAGLDSLLGDSSGTLKFDVSDNPANNMAPGQYTIEGELTVTPRGGGDPVTVVNNTGFLNVQSKGVLEVVDVEASQPTVTERQSGWFVDVVVKNTGESAITVLADRCSLVFDGGSEWEYSLDNNDTTLNENESTTLMFQMTNTDVPETYQISSYVVAEEINSTRLLTDTSLVSDAVLVQTEADVSIVIQKPRDKVTAETQQPWVVYVDVTNTGESAARVHFLSDSTNVIFPNADTPFDITRPPAFVGVTDTVSANEKKRIEFWVDGTKNVTPPGITPIVATVDWEEINTSRRDTLLTTDQIEVQLEPNPQYIRMTPTAVTRGKLATFKVDVDEVPGTSDLILNRDQTRLTFDFGGGVMRQTALSIASPDTIMAGAETTLIFQSIAIDEAFDNLPLAPTLTIVGIENDNPFNPDPITTDSVNVENPTTVTANLFTYRSTVSSSQTRPWELGMEVTNNGTSDVVFVPGATRLEFFIGGEGDRTSEFVAPLVDSTFTQSKSDTLFHDMSPDTLLFEVSQTGWTTGPLEIRGHFSGWDFVADTLVTDVASLYEMVVQKPGSLVVTDIRPGRVTVTAGQKADWNVVVDVRNVGEAAVDLKFGSNTPTVRTLPSDAFEWTLADSLGSGAALLVGGPGGGPVDSLVFQCDSTLGTVGDIRLYFVVEGTDTNSGDPVLFDTDVPEIQPGLVTIQNPPKLRITRTEVRTPVARRANLGQTFPVVVEVENVADTLAAGAVDVIVELKSTGGTVNPPDTLIVASILPGTTAVDTFFVVAAGSVGPETFNTEIVDARDDNAREPLWEVESHIDASEDIEKYHPSLLAIDSVTASLDPVTRGQTTEWYVDVTVNNDGTVSRAPLDVMAPSETDVSFWKDQRELVGFEIKAPETFLSKPTLRLDPSEGGVLRYTILATGNNDVGDVTIRVEESWADVYDLLTRDTLDSGTVHIINPSGLFVDSTYVDATTAPNQPQNNLVLINSGESFRVRVNVANAGEDVGDVDSVLVRLQNQNESHPVRLLSDYQSIPKDGNGTFVFDDVVLARLAPGEDFRVEDVFVSIVYAVSAHTGEPATTIQPRDAEETIIVQQPASLSVTLRVSDPPDARTVSTNQSFTLTARVDNNGVAEVDSLGTLVLTLVEGFSLVGLTPDTVAFDIGQTISWDVEAPETEILDQTLQVEIAEVPIDRNISKPATVTDSIATVELDVVKGAAFTQPKIEIIDPPGAKDNTLSTYQDFIVKGSVRAEETTVDITATLSTLSGSGFTIIDPEQQTLGDGGDGELSATWRITAPTVAASEQFEVQFNGRDVNTSEAVADTTDPLPVQVVQRAELNLEAFITSPEAQDGIVSERAPFTIKAVVNNVGKAGVDTTTLKPRISLNPPEGYVVSPAGLQSFTVDAADSVVWILTAPSHPTIVDLITVQLESVPADTNTNQPAYVANDEDDILIRTGDELITVDNITTGLGIDKKVVPKGSREITLLGIEVANPRDSADPVRVDTILVSLLDKNGRSVSKPSRTLTELYVVRGDDHFPGDVNQDPIPVALDNVQITAENADTLMFVVGVSNKASLDEFAISIENGDAIVIKNTISDKSVPVADKTTLGDVTGKLRSRSLVLLSNNPQEYAHNYPNPFRAGDQETNIAYVVGKAGPVSVKIYDLTGSLVCEQQYASGEPEASPGPQEVTWNGRNDSGEVVRNGIYICQIDTASGSVKIKIAVAK